MPRTAVVVDVDNVLFWGAEPGGVRPADRLEDGGALGDLLNGLRDRFGEGASLRLIATEKPGRHADRLAKAAAGAAARLTLVPQRGHASPVDVEIAVQAMEEVRDGAKRLVIASTDSGMVPIIEAAKRVGVHTTVVTPPERLPVALGVATDELVNRADLRYVAEGLILPGDAPQATRALTDHFGRATRDVVVVDRYVGTGTIRLLLWVDAPVRVTVIGSNIEREASEEAKELQAAGRKIRLIRVPDREMAHDRWFRIDEQWWHSGASLKDLGQRHSRISRIDDSEIASHEAMLSTLVRSGIDLLAQETRGPTRSGSRPRRPVRRG